MKVEESTTAVPAARRHIIRRPRLTRMLDESGARIILLVAPAGYGKTTLAREWLEDPSRRAAWYRGGPESADVAAVSVGLATSAAQIVPGAGNRMRERLGATSRPQEDAALLAEMLIEDLEGWPDDAWLAVDDYHFAMESAAAERFIEKLVTFSSLRFLVTSRRRPYWASARRRAYGEVIEIDRTFLSMTDEEAEAVIGRRLESSSVVARARGWPAVIGMAALTDEPVIPEDELPATLYEYFAEELYEAADLDTRWGLCQLSIARYTSPELGAELLGRNLEMVMEHALNLGIAIGDGRASTELHPLLRRFLNAKIKDFDDAAVEASIGAVAQHLLRNRHWDEVFELAQRFNCLPLVAELVEAALPDVLALGRVETVERWLDFASEQLFSAPILDFAEAELSFREGLYTKAETLGLRAANTNLRNTPWEATASTRAGRAAHLDGRPNDAIRHHEAALKTSADSPVRREALWGLVVALVEVEEIKAAEDALAKLEAEQAMEVDDLLRVASGHYLISVRGGRSAEAGALVKALQLIERSRDPLARSSFLNSCAAGLILNGRYQEAGTVARRQLAEAESYRLKFVIPYAYLRLAEVAGGLRRFAEAFEAVRTAERLSSDLGEKWMGGATPAVRALLFLSAGRPVDAVTVIDPSGQGPASIRAELVAVQSLALACVKESDASRSLAKQAREMSLSIEIASLTALAKAVRTCSDLASPAAKNATIAAFDFAYSHGTVGHFVSAYRAEPSILHHIAKSSDPRLEEVMGRALDHKLARHAGLEISENVDARKSNLSKREQEVFSLLSQGLTNREIAAKLFISESTTKVHVRHILEKLDARTRTEAVIKGEQLTW